MRIGGSGEPSQDSTKDRNITEPSAPPQTAPGIYTIMSGGCWDATGQFSRKRVRLREQPTRPQSDRQLTGARASL